MRIGAMNHPRFDVLDEIEWMAGMDLDFIDLTMEPPCAASWQLEPQKVLESLERHKLGIVGHTAYYLPVGSPFEELRKAAVREFCRCLDIFARLGARWMNVHPDNKTPLQDRHFYFDRNIESLEELVAYGRKAGVGLMVENIPGDIFNSVHDLGALLRAVPELGLHLDIGHAHLCHIPRNAEAIIEAHGNRLRHVHLHDNKGGKEDLHLPLGVGTIDVPRVVHALKASGYDGMITLEVFSPERRYLDQSRMILRQVWDQAD